MVPSHPSRVKNNSANHTRAQVADQRREYDEHEACQRPKSPQRASVRQALRQAPSKASKGQVKRASVVGTTRTKKKATKPALCTNQPNIHSAAKRAEQPRQDQASQRSIIVMTTQSILPLLADC
eukprot:TRINITY_DN2453_c0_g1_i1.p3 TRINITY_DN2453_c0_g1~~TRINITY_DN2453_c0_g1_i1.p3  ORF type:complete len:124 (-),score=12.95 TRINITY_DN2453_c0_g1_i1:41-412(-)